MAALTIRGSELIVALKPLERVAAFHGDVRIALSAIRSVSLELDPWCALRGIRAPGTGIPGVIAYGVRRATGDRPDFAALLGRDPAIRIELAPPAPFARLLISVRDPEAVIAAVARGTGA